jgi:DNA polymerase V
MQPALRHVPVAVLSNNDGCIIARTNEVKAAGVKMGQPYHECEQMLKNIDATVLSANFLLYRNCAKRLQAILKSLPTNGVEVYSIDESFVVLDDTRIDDMEVWAQQVRKLVWDWASIPVTVGVAPSRALAKIAVSIGKKTESHTVDLTKSTAEVDAILRTIAIEDVWGVGRRLAPKFKVCGIRTAWDLAHITPNDRSLKLLNKTTQELVGELCGWSEPRYEQLDHKKSMTHSRSFGAAITDKNDIRSALSSFSGSLAAKLRKQGLVAGHISVFLRYAEQGSGSRAVAQYSERTVAPTADTFALETHVQAMVQDLYVQGRRYKKAGIVLSKLQPNDMYQIAFGETEERITHSQALMQAVDDIASKYEVTLQPAAAHLGDKRWQGKRQLLSPYDHASWQTIPKVVT